MDLIDKALVSVQKFCGINSATLSGAIDVVVVRQPDGSLKSSSFHVRFGKLGLLSSSERVVHIDVNGEPTHLQMKVGEAGHAFFVSEAPQEQVPRNLCTSPLFSSKFARSYPSIPPGSPVSEHDGLGEAAVGDAEEPEAGAAVAEVVDPGTWPRKASRELNTTEQDISTWNWGEMPVSSSRADGGAGGTGRAGVQSGAALLMSPADSDSEAAEDEPSVPEPPLATPLDALEPEPHFALVEGDLALSLCSAESLQGLAGEEADGRFEQDRVTFAELSSNPGLMADPRLVCRMGGAYHPWKVAGPLVMAQVIFGRSLDPAAIGRLEKGPGVAADLDAGEGDEREDGAESPTAATAPDQASGWSWPWQRKGGEEESPDAAGPPVPQFVKTVNMTSEQLESLNLQPGANILEFSVITSFQGKTTVRCAAYLWDHTDKLVVSDIDGTITKSDVIGHAAAFLGTSRWTQDGVARLFSGVHDNGYRVLYLSSRPISYHRQTKKYISSLVQESDSLPDGPVLVSPYSFLKALDQEVIKRQPQQFKIPCLREVSHLFPKSPFWAGFGNRESDAKAYRAVEIAESRIFTIDPKGRVGSGRGHFKTSYKSLHEILDLVFPPVNGDAPWSRGETIVDFGDLAYWEQPIAPLTDSIEIT